MKRFISLTPHQKDLATDKALEVLIKLLLSDDFDYKFFSPLAQRDFYNAIKSNNEFEEALASDEIAAELYPSAECMAETAWYPSNEEYVLGGVI